MDDSDQTTTHRRLILDLDENSITFDPPLSLPLSDERGNIFDDLMAVLEEALRKFGEVSA